MRQRELGKFKIEWRLRRYEEIIRYKENEVGKKENEVRRKVKFRKEVKKIFLIKNEDKEMEKIEERNR